MVSKRDKEALIGLDRIIFLENELLKRYNTKDSRMVAIALRNITDAHDIRQRIKAKYDKRRK